MATIAGLAAIVSQARDLMNDEGAHWIQNRYISASKIDGRHSFCSAGALRQVIFGEVLLTKSHYDDTYVRTLAVLAETVCQSLGHTWERTDDPYANEDTIVEWNDDLGRTWQEVNAVFTRAIEKLEAQGL